MWQPGDMRQPEHVSGAGAENGAERARKSIERERSGEQAESATHNPLKPNNWLLTYIIRILQLISNFHIQIYANHYFKVTDARISM